MGSGGKGFGDEGSKADGEGFGDEGSKAGEGFKAMYLCIYVSI